MTKQTAVEYLVNTLFTRDEKQIHYDIIQQAKEMEKQQMIDALTYGNKSELMASQKMFAEQYYNETYGSKGSDEHIVDTNEMIYPKTAFEILQPKLTIADTLEFREKHLPEILNAMEEYATSYQTEISDEEIEERAERNINPFSFIDGAKWYREQLKNLKLK